MVQLKGELCYLRRNKVKRLKNPNFTNYFDLKKGKNTAKLLPSQI